GGSGRDERQLPAGVHGRPPVAGRSGALVARVLVRQVGGRYARGRLDRFSRRPVDRLEWKRHHHGRQSAGANPAARLRTPRDRSHRRRSQGVHEAVDGHAETTNRGRYRARGRDLPGKREIVSAHEMNVYKSTLKKAQGSWLWALGRFGLRDGASEPAQSEPRAQSRKPRAPLSRIPRHLIGMLIACPCVLTAALALAQTAVPRLPPALPNPPAASLQAPLDPGYAALIAMCKTPPPARGGRGPGGGARGVPPPQGVRDYTVTE